MCKQKLLSVAVFLLSGLLAGTAASAQTAGASAAFPVYLDVHVNSGDAAMYAFASKLLELGLAGTQGIEIKAGQPNPCVGLNVGAQKANIRPPASEPDGTRFAVVKLSLEEQRSGWLLDYEVAEGRWLSERATCAAPALHQTQPAAQARLLDTLNIVTRLMSSAMSPWIVTSQLPIELTVTGNDQIKEELAAFLASRIAGTRDFTVLPNGARNPGTPAYTVLVEVNGTLFLKALVGKSGNGAHLTVSGKNIAASSVDVQSRPTDERPDFYRAVADAAIKQLYEARAASSLALSTTRVEGVSSDQLVRQARTLLCTDVPEAGQAPCRPRPEDAVAVLRKAGDADIDTRLLRGRAQLAAGQNVDAAMTLDNVSADAAADAPQQLLALDLGGDAYSAAKQYDTAGARYARWLGLAATSNVGAVQASAVAVKHSQVLRIKHAYNDALDTLFSTLTRWPDAPAIAPELASVLPELTRPQLERVAMQLANRDMSRFGPARVLTLRYLAAGQSHDAEYQAAVATLTSALPFDTRKEATVDLAWVYSNWASATSAPADRTQLFRQGVAVVMPAVEARVPTADNAFLTLNHRLGDDRATIAVFQRIIARDASDVSALMSIMFVCTENLADFGCAADAARKLDGLPSAREDVVDQLSIAEVQVLGGEAAAADAKVERLLALPSTKYRVVEMFYSSWIKFATGRREAGGGLVNEWRRELDAFRKTNGDFNWLFGGARKALAASTQVSPADRAYLGSMIDAMEDRTRPIPAPFGS